MMHVNHVSKVTVYRETEDIVKRDKARGERERLCTTYVRGGGEREIDRERKREREREGR